MDKILFTQLTVGSLVAYPSGRQNYLVSAAHADYAVFKNARTSEYTLVLKNSPKTPDYFYSIKNAA
ncbi:hypothetical protein [Mucilaginibacter defluvii]|uniref:Uncharacterized protein n=1 Tax=Mucilaginibacter defluvii TaxID=1196019 RepID=A0ABP9FSH7_9SPHI